MNFIAVDIGSTFIKAIVYNLDKKIVLWQEKYHSPQKKYSTDNYIFENDAIMFVNIVEIIIQKAHNIVGKCDAILFSTQQHGCVLRHNDCENDTYISWQDTRCMHINSNTKISYLEELQQILSPNLIENTGVPIKPALALCNLYTLFQKNILPKKTGSKIYTLGSYVIEALTGNNICHITNAAPMGFTNILEKKWCYDILEKVGLDFLDLPQIVDEMNCIGYYKKGDINLAVYPDVGDVQACVYGVGTQSGDLFIHIGTSGQVVYVSDTYVKGDYEIRPYFHEKYCKVISRMPGGRNFDVQIEYMREIGEKIFGIHMSKEEIWGKVDKLKEAEILDTLEVDCSFFETPDVNIGGSISGITSDNFKVENLVKATALDFAKKYRRFADKLCDCENFDGTLYFAGGAVLKNKILQQAIISSLGINKIAENKQDEVYAGMLKLALECLK